jgi:hypothetical protein
VIGINRSVTFGIGDGLSHTEFTNLAKALGDELMERTRGAERLALGWLERRIDAELEAYPAIVELGHRIIAEAFSSATIQPGVTTTDDVVWWMRQRMLDLGLRAWFQPTIDIQADGLSLEMPGDSKQSRAERRKRILPGDLIHCDMGFHYLGLATDQQQNAYVLRPGETDAPEVLRGALADGNRLQDIHAEEMAPGRTGNEVLKAALARAKQEGIEASIYTHPIGYHGHGAGPTIGLWDQQDGVPGKGDYEVFDRTCYAIELNVTRAIPEWGGQLPGRPRGQAPGRARGQVVRVALEEDAALVDGRLQWLSGRQTRFHLIG